MPNLFDPQIRNPQYHRGLSDSSVRANEAAAEVLLVTTPHCPHCRSIRAHIGEVAASHTAVANRELSAPDDPELTSELKIRAAPTLLAFRGGKEVARHVGAGSAADVERIFAAASQTSQSTRRFSISAENRKIRSAVGLVLMAAGAFSEVFLLALLGTVFIAAGWYDYLIRS